MIEHSVSIEVTPKTVVEGDLRIPSSASGLVVFVHGSGSSRFSPRNQYVANQLNQAGLATLLFDLLTEDEEAVDVATAKLRFDIGLLAERVMCATHWLAKRDETSKLRIGYFGASTGAAAALVAAARLPKLIHAVVSRGGRPDLAGAMLEHVKAPTLLIVGDNDPQVLDLNRRALNALQASIKKHLEIIPGATHLFEEPGTLEQVAVLAADWFYRHLGVEEQYGESEQKDRHSERLAPTGTGSQHLMEYDSYFCDSCRQYVYNESAGDSEHNIAPKTQVQNLPHNWRCPICGAHRDRLREATMMDGFA